MRLRGSRLLACWVLACAAAGAQIAHAHEFKLDAVINAFIKIEPDNAQLVVRVPLYLFKSAKFPVNNIEIDVDKSAPAIERAHRIAADAGHPLDVVVSLCGTSGDPQDLDRQAERLAAAGAAVHLSNAGAARAAVDLLAERRPT